MASASEISLSFLASSFAPDPPANVVFGLFIVACAAGLIHYASTVRLARVLTAAIAHVEETYLEAIEAGTLSKTDVLAADSLISLQSKVSTISEASLRHSLSYRTAFREFIKGHTLTVLQCIHEVRQLETRMEILKEGRLRDLAIHNETEILTRTVSLRRRHWQNHSNLCYSHY
ncbi:hypothetical protein DFH09DRAFT_1455929 [Mycena vulgaris]|nr:hypothetical protein DFH09DRAFT_1455929 [Mycena vulgaris]